MVGSVLRYRSVFIHARGKYVGRRGISFDTRRTAAGLRSHRRCHYLRVVIRWCIRASLFHPKHILIAAVQIMGASSSNDMVKLYNPNADAVDMTGWKLHKKSQTGTDYPLKNFLQEAPLPPEAGLSGRIQQAGFLSRSAQMYRAPKRCRLTIAWRFLDSAGNIIDAVAWGTGTDQYGEGDPYSTDPVANQILVRRSVGSAGGVADTGSNINDFSLQ